jgi:HPt (histidine-containing phosphotransfer) domain-containing protein
MQSIERQLANLLRLGGEAFLREMLDIFLGSAPTQIEAARTALLAGDLVGVQRAVHSLRSSAGNFGAETVCELAAQTEERAMRHDAAALAPLLAQLEAAFAEVQTYLQEKRKQHS